MTSKQVAHYFTVVLRLDESTTNASDVICQLDRLQGAAISAMGHSHAFAERDMYKAQAEINAQTVVRQANEIRQLQKAGGNLLREYLE